MKLLIADDEKLTRDGLKAQIGSTHPEFSEILVSEDGQIALGLCAHFTPDILLSDIRMPRVNGIELATKLQEINPHMAIIFMSGYSDKEYLKAAIKLKAVTYLEKPFDSEELDEALLNAVSQVETSRKNVAKLAISDYVSKSEIASALTSPGIDKEILTTTVPTDANINFFTVLLRFTHQSNDIEKSRKIAEEVFEKLCAKKGLNQINTFRANTLIVHIWSEKDYAAHRKELLMSAICDELIVSCPHFHMVVGKNVTGYAEVYNSYNSAVIELQNSFFYKENTCIIYEHVDSYKEFGNLSDYDITDLFRESLLRTNKTEAAELLNSLFTKILVGKNLLPNQIKDLYYRLLNAIYDIRKSMNLEDSATGRKSVWGSLDECESIYELNQALLSELNLFFTAADAAKDSTAIIPLIKDFIASNYSDEALSIRDISEHVALSGSYICTLFKNATGLTLNQYISDYRIERAKELLSNPKNKISDISSSVGYSDGNYFGKAFKKRVGLSPSEYRESSINK